jgi:hypothetical protein
LNVRLKDKAEIALNSFRAQATAYLLDGPTMMLLVAYTIAHAPLFLEANGFFIPPDRVFISDASVPQFEQLCKNLNVHVVPEEMAWPARVRPGSS